jgi:hypothetical protein
VRSSLLRTLSLNLCRPCDDVVSGGFLNFQTNVKEHATLSARARVDHGVGVKTTEDHVNRAADRGCCVSTCSAIFSAMSTGPVSTPWKNH